MDLIRVLLAAVFLVLGIAFWVFILRGAEVVGRLLAWALFKIGEGIGWALKPLVETTKRLFSPGARRIGAGLRAFGFFVGEWIVATLMVALLGTFAVCGLLILLLCGVSATSWLLRSIGADSLGQRADNVVGPELLQVLGPGFGSGSYLILSAAVGLGLVVRDKLRELRNERSFKELNTSGERSPLGQFYEANSAVEASPDDPYWRMMRARACIQLGAIDQAIGDLRRTLVLASAQENQSLRDQARQALRELGANP